MLTLSIKEETFGADGHSTFEVPLLNERLKLRELIQAKVAAKISDLNSKAENHEVSNRYISNKEKVLNRFSLKKRKEKLLEKVKAMQLDTEKEGYETLSAFQQNAFFVIVDGEQKTDLEEELLLTEQSEVHFLRLTPLVGG